MRDSSSSAASGGTSIFTLLTVLFVGLKLTGYIDWPWVWVLAPLLAEIALVIVILFVVVVCEVKKAERRRR